MKTGDGHCRRNASTSAEAMPPWHDVFQRTIWQVHETSRTAKAALEGKRLSSLKSPEASQRVYHWFIGLPYKDYRDRQQQPQARMHLKHVLKKR